MVITKTPFRISFFGGGTDYPSWFEKHGGAVISTTINKYCYITCRHLPPFFDFNYKIRYNEQEHAKLIEEIRHPSVRACLTYSKTRDRIEMQHNGDLPAMSGLGSSSSFTVGFLNALYHLQDLPVSKKKLALDAIEVEQDVIKEIVGSQDQVAAAHGGFNKIEFGGVEGVKVIPLDIDTTTHDALQDHLMLFFTGFSRHASEIAAEQIRNTDKNEDDLHKIAAMVPKAIEILKAGPSRINDFGRLLDKAWQLKRNLSSKITNDYIDGMYSDAKQAGALGGKILGAGGGGFMLVFAEPKRHQKIKNKLGNYLHVPFKFENTGSQVIFKLDNETHLV